MRTPGWGMREESSFWITLAWLISSWSASKLPPPPGLLESHTPFKWKVQSVGELAPKAQDPCASGCAVCWSQARVEGKGQLDIDGEGERGQEFISPDRRPFWAMKTTGLGPRKPVVKLGSILSQPCDPAPVSPLWASEPGSIRVFTPAGFCPDTPSLLPFEKPRRCPTEAEVILPSSETPRDSRAQSQPH